MSEIKKYKDIKGRRWTEGGIPKWIFRTGGLEYENLPPTITTIYTHILDQNPGYELFYFSDADCVEFILEEYGKEYLDYYNTLIPTAYKADFFRYCLLNKYGGCYGDFTLLPLISYNEMTRGVDRVLVRDDGSGSKGSLWNASMCTKAADPILYSCIAICIDHIITGYFGNTPIDVTGPTVLGEAFRQVGYNTPNEFDISLGDNRGSRIYTHDVTLHVKDVHGRAVIIKKMTDVHNATLYNETNIHYDEAWHHAKIYTHGRNREKSISYAITVYDEHKQLDRLLNQLKSILKKNDEIIVQMDDKATDEVKEVIKNHGLPLNTYSLNNNFAAFKNNLKSLCTKDYIFQIDADEFLSDNLLKEINILIRIHNGADAIAIPRINTLVDESIIEDYKNNLAWKGDKSSWLNYPDVQTRLFKNKSEIYWENAVHEYLIGLKTIVNLSNEYNIIHVKSHQKQEAQNNFYKSTFSDDLL
jgi:mannosyltransferase OCH1-like enzyme